MGNTTTASVTGAQVAPAKSAIKDLPIAKVWAFAVGQFGWALLSGIISNWLVYFYQPDQETISQGQTVFVPQGLVVLGIVTVVGGITAFARFFDAFVDPAVASLSDRCDAKSGRRMPFLKFAALPLAVVTVLVFWSPINGTGWVNAAFLFVTVIGYFGSTRRSCSSLLSATTLPSRSTARRTTRSSPNSATTPSSNSPSPPPSPSLGWPARPSRTWRR